MVKELIVFDLDGTLAESKQSMDAEMAELVIELLKKYKVAVISGGMYKQFQKQFVPSLSASKDLLKNLFLFPTCATCFYKFESDWKQVYSHDLTQEDKSKIMDAFSKMYEELNYKDPEKTYGVVIEDRDTQITFSACGQKAPIEVKSKFDPDSVKRLKMIKVLLKYLPEFEIRMGGTNSIDVTRKGIDKAYGIRQIEKHLGIAKDSMLFIGDALFEGGNDYPVKTEGVECIEVKDHEECKDVIRGLLGKA